MDHHSKLFEVVHPKTISTGDGEEEIVSAAFLRSSEYALTDKDKLHRSSGCLEFLPFESEKRFVALYPNECIVLDDQGKCFLISDKKYLVPLGLIFLFIRSLTDESLPNQLFRVLRYVDYSRE